MVFLEIMNYASIMSGLFVVMVDHLLAIQKVVGSNLGRSTSR